jgi:thioredoxin 1
MSVQHVELSRAEVDASQGLLVLEFGTGWCSICAAAKPLIDRAFAEHPGVRREWVEDGKGKPLGRSFAIKLWPTLVFLRDGHEVARVVRPSDLAALRGAFERLGSTASVSDVRRA